MLVHIFSRKIKKNDRKLTTATSLGTQSLDAMARRDVGMSGSDVVCVRYIH